MEYSQKPSLQFIVCTVPVTVDGHYNFCASLEQIACLAPDKNRMHDQAEMEDRLLVLYRIKMPPWSVPCAQDVDVVSVTFFSVCI